MNVNNNENQVDLHEWSSLRTGPDRLINWKIRFFDLLEEFSTYLSNESVDRSITLTGWCKTIEINIRYLSTLSTIIDFLQSAKFDCKAFDENHRRIHIDKKILHKVNLYWHLFVFLLQILLINEVNYRIHFLAENWFWKKWRKKRRSFQYEIQRSIYIEFSGWGKTAWRLRINMMRNGWNDDFSLRPNNEWVCFSFSSMTI